MEDRPAVDRVTIVVYEGFQPLDAVGPHEVFAGTQGRYEVRIASVFGGPVRAESGLVLDTVPLPRRVTARDLVLVAGGNGVYDAVRDPTLVRWLVTAGARAGRTGSVCSGAFLLAEAGLLDGRRAATHWHRARRLARTYPAVDVDPEALWLRDGDVWTSAGVTAGIDLALAMVEHDHGAPLAQTIARHLVMYLRRPGGQSQYAAPAFSAVPADDVVRAATERIDADPTADWSLGSLAAAVGVSGRHLARLFDASVGTSPTRYLETRRVDLARTLLDAEPSATVEAVARRSGFGSAETLRRAFLRNVGVPPDAYRNRFSLVTDGPDR